MVDPFLVLIMASFKSYCLVTHWGVLMVEWLAMMKA